ncbi:MAG: OmpA family protein [Candidatus Binataceae bacterium]|jgi:outer membrane protein OmpA-like peptidoglycan-associated protein
MLTSHNAQRATKNRRALPRVFHLVQDESIRPENGCLWGGVWGRACIFAGVILLLTTSGCIATRSWVQDQLNPIKGQLNDTNAKADSALAGLQNLQLERRLVLDSRHGPTFAFGSAALTENAKSEIDGFLQDLEGQDLEGSTGSASGRLFVVAGHTDSVGTEEYNYELGQRRADGVAGFLVGKEGVDPTQVRVVSYGASKPVADNSTLRGRRTNRRVEILVYQEKIASANQEKLATGNEAQQLPTSVR